MSSVYRNKPNPFFKVVIHSATDIPGITGALAGYEKKHWRVDEMAEYLFEWLPEFALGYSELRDAGTSSFRRLLRDAALTVYTTEKYGKRGEFGELMLHALVREVFNSEPAISKIYYKSSTNETVKGFDAVHVVESGSELELWLGEVKFYKNIDSAIYDVVKEIQSHFESDYLRNEFILIGNKIDPAWKYSEQLKKLISTRTSLDQIFQRVRIPVLLTYESDVVGSHEIENSEFIDKMNTELLGVYSKFKSNKLPEVSVHLFLVPLCKKENLIKVLHEKLEGQQR